MLRQTQAYQVTIMVQALLVMAGQLGNECKLKTQQSMHWLNKVPWHLPIPHPYAPSKGSQQPVNWDALPQAGSVEHLWHSLASRQPPWPHVPSSSTGPERRPARLLRGYDNDLRRQASPATTSGARTPPDLTQLSLPLVCRWISQGARCTKRRVP